MPSNIGPLTTPNYEALAAQGIYPLANGGRVFAGQRDETFYIDLGATFDTVNLRRDPADPRRRARTPTTRPTRSGSTRSPGFNVNTIALEIPIDELTPEPERRARALRLDEPPEEPPPDATTAPSFGSGGWVQVARMANPLVNELIIPTDRKDRWNATDPKDEAQFVNFYLNPSLAAVLNLRFGTAFPTAGRTDLVATLLQYDGDGTCGKNDRCSELLRLNLGVAPTAPDDQKRLGVLAGDNAGFPNGRRPNDDVTDIALRVVGGILLADDPAAFPRLGDGVNFNVGAESSL